LPLILGLLKIPYYKTAFDLTRQTSQILGKKKPFNEPPSSQGFIDSTV
jgi:hypothetical protein